MNSFQICSYQAKGRYLFGKSLFFSQTDCVLIQGQFLKAISDNQWKSNYHFWRHHRIVLPCQVHVEKASYSPSANSRSLYQGTGLIANKGSDMINDSWCANGKGQSLGWVTLSTWSHHSDTAPGHAGPSQGKVPPPPPTGCTSCFQLSVSALCSPDFSPLWGICPLATGNKQEVGFFFTWLAKLSMKKRCIPRGCVELLLYWRTTL